MILLRLLPALSLLLVPVHALHESEAGVIDWHKSFIGVPRTQPTFHRVTSQQATTTSVIVTGTSNNALAALNPVDGSIVWRHVWQAEDRVLLHKQHGEFLASLSGPGGSTLRVLDVLTGHILHESLLHQPGSGFLTEPSTIGTQLAFSDNTLYVLTNGHSLRRVSLTDFEQSWVWTSQDQASLVIYSDAVVTGDLIHIVGLAKSFASYTLHVTSLSSTTGEVINDTEVSSSLAGIEDFAVLVDRIVWLETSTIKSIPISSLKARPSLVKGSFTGLTNVGAGQVVGTHEDGSAAVLMSKNNHLEEVWVFTEPATTPIYSAGLDKSGHPYISRIYWSPFLRAASIEVFGSHLAGGTGLVSGYSIPFDTDSHGILKQVSLDVANPREMIIVARLLLTTSTGAIQLWQTDRLQWTREESLATIQMAEFVELPEVKDGSHDIETFSQRVLRQLSDAQDFPRFMLHFIRRLATGSHTTVVAPKVDTDSMTRDTFGFRKLIIAATEYGKIFALDSSNGKVLWSRLIYLGPKGQLSGSVEPQRLFTLKTVTDGAGDPEVALVAIRHADDGSKETAIYHFNALTGVDVQTGRPSPIMPEAAVFPSPAVNTFVLQNGTLRYMLIVDDSLRFNFFPGNPYVRDDFIAKLPSLYVPLSRVDKAAGTHRLQGHQIAADPVLGYKFTGYPTWSISLPDEENIQSIIHPLHQPIASFGQVLGNRTTLYKYLNPNLVVVLTSTHSVQPAACGVYLVDSVKGSVIYRAHLPSHKGACDIKLTFSENWMVYHYYDEELSTSDASKGWRLVSVELYEGQKADDKTRSSEISSFDPASSDYSISEQSYVFQHGITAITTTTTKFSIASKDLIVATNNHRIHSIPRILLNPRRPTHKITAEEAEERLIQYEPLLPEDPRRIISHRYDVANIRQIKTSPALLESTSLVFAFGLDLFLTKVAPSNTFDVLSESFNKLQLIVTISVLALGIMITRPMVRRKKLKEQWYQ